MISEAISTSNNWEDLANNNNFINYQSGQTSTLAGSFTAIGRSSQLEGALFSTDTGQTTDLIETPSAFLYLKVSAKDDFNQDDFDKKSDEIRTQLLTSKKSRGYFDWLNSAKSTVEVDDWRYLIY